MEKGRNGWVTLGSRSRIRRQRRRKTSQQQEEPQSTKLSKSKQSANTPPPIAFPAREKKFIRKPTKSDEREINKVINRAPEVSARRASEPIAIRVDPTPTHRSPMAVRIMDYPKNRFSRGSTKNKESKNHYQEVLKNETSCHSSSASDCSSNKNTPSGKKSDIKIEWIFQKKTMKVDKVTTNRLPVPASSATPNATHLKKKSWPKIKESANMPNLNPEAPCFKANPFARRTFKSFTPRAPGISWQPVSHQNMMPQWRGDYRMVQSFSYLPSHVQHDNIHNDNCDSVSNLFVPYTYGPF